MGHWSVLASVDQMEDRTYVVPLPLQEAIDAVGLTLQAPGRVVTDQLPDGTYRARTLKHTPGWAFLLFPTLPFARMTKTAVLTFSEVDDGTGVTVHGVLDTRAAMRLRAMTTLIPEYR